MREFYPKCVTQERQQSPESGMEERETPPEGGGGTSSTVVRLCTTVVTGGPATLSPSETLKMIFFLIFIIQLQLYAFSPHPSTLEDDVLCAHQLGHVTWLQCDCTCIVPRHYRVTSGQEARDRITNCTQDK